LRQPAVTGAGGMRVHFSSATEEWATPQEFFDALNEEFGFTLDVAASPENRKCRRYFCKGLLDGLKASWYREVCWMNPPYGRTIGQWMKKAYDESRTNGATVVCLIPARTDTAWWHDYAAKGEVRFIRGRLKFGGHKNSAPFPSAVVIFRAEGQAPLSSTALQPLEPAQIESHESDSFAAKGRNGGQR
jgi:phage N-6-adenine-methyltransferase